MSDNNKMYTLEQIRKWNDVVDVYEYNDKDNTPYKLNVRFKPTILEDGKIKKNFYQYIYLPEHKKYESSQGGLKPCLYKLPELLQGIKEGKRVFLVEGEKDVNSLRSLGEVATTSGSKDSWKPELAEYFRGASEVIILPDQDDKGGEEYGKDASRDISKIVPLTYIVNVTKGKDITDFLQVEKLEDLEPLINFVRNNRKDKIKKEEIEKREIDKAIEEFDADVMPGKYTPPLPPKEPKQKKKNQTDQANEIIEKIKNTLKTRWDGKSLYILNSSKKWMDMEAGGEQELLRQIYHATGIIPSPDTQKIIITILKFLQDGNKEVSPPKRSTFKDDAILYNTGKHFVSISKDEIQKKEHDCIFLENELQVEHPDFTLNCEESLENLISDLIPVKTQEDKLLLSIYLASLFVPEISKPALNLEGDQGSGKTSIARTIKRIYDPNKIEMVDYGKIQDLCLTFSYNDFLILNNLSKIKSNTSDVLCNIIDGKCISERQLFTNNKLFVSEIKGTFAITAIETGKKNSDLLDRMIKITLERISSEKRLPEKKIEKLFKEKLPSILSAIFHLLQGALKHIQHIEDTEIPEFRLADWYLWSLSIATAMGKADEFKRIIKLQKEIMLNDEISNNDVVETIFKYLEDRLQHVNSLSMTSTEWIDVINEYAKKDLIKGRIGGIFKRVKVTFDSLGYVFTEKKEGRNKRLWEVSKKVKNCVSEKTIAGSHSLNSGDRGDTEDIFYVSFEKAINKQFINCGDTETQNSNYLEFLKNNISIDIDNTTESKNEKVKDIKVVKNCVSMSPDTIKPYTVLETEETQNGDTKNSLCLYVSGCVSEKISCKSCANFIEGSSPAAMGTCKVTKNSFYSGELHTCGNYAEPELEEAPF